MAGLVNPALAFSALLLWISQPWVSLTWVQPDCSSCLRYLSLMANAGIARSAGLPALAG